MVHIGGFNPSDPQTPPKTWFSRSTTGKFFKFTDMDMEIGSVSPHSGFAKSSSIFSTHTVTHTYIYIYICMTMYVNVRIYKHEEEQIKVHCNSLTSVSMFVSQSTSCMLVCAGLPRPDAP